VVAGLVAVVDRTVDVGQRLLENGRVRGRRPDRLGDEGVLREVGDVREIPAETALVGGEDVQTEPVDRGLLEQFVGLPLGSAMETSGGDSDTMSKELTVTPCGQAAGGNVTTATPVGTIPAVSWNFVRSMGILSTARGLYPLLSFSGGPVRWV